MGKHRIDLLDENPLKEQYRRIPPNMEDEVRKHLDDFTAGVIISHSESSWDKPVVLCSNLNGKMRMWITVT